MLPAKIVFDYHRPRYLARPWRARTDVLAQVFLDGATTARSAVVAPSKTVYERRRRDHSGSQHAVATAIKHCLRGSKKGYSSENYTLHNLADLSHELPMWYQGRLILLTKSEAHGVRKLLLVSVPSSGVEIAINSHRLA